MQVKGKLLVKYDTHQVSERFRKREFVIEYADQPMYPQYVKFQLVQERCELLDNYNAGDELEVHFNLRGREWTNPKGEKVYFNSLDAWRLVPVQEQTPPPPQDMNADFAQAAAEPMNIAEMDGDDDLPF